VRISVPGKVRRFSLAPQVLKVLAVRLNLMPKRTARCRNDPEPGRQFEIARRISVKQCQQVNFFRPALLIGKPISNATVLRMICRQSDMDLQAAPRGISRT